MNLRKIFYLLTSLVILNTINTAEICKTINDEFFNSFTLYQYVCFEFSDQKNFNAFKKIMGQLPGKATCIFERSDFHETDMIDFKFNEPIKPEDLENMLKQFHISCKFHKLDELRNIN